MPERLRIENLCESNLDDLVSVCSSKKLDDPVHQHGMRIKKKWLTEMLKNYGSIAKIAYLDGKPVAQILYYPESADPTSPCKRKNVLVVMCTYNPTPEARGMGIGTRLLQDLIEDAKKRRTCLGTVSCRFMLAKTFNTHEALPLSDFYSKNWFHKIRETDQLMFLPIEGTYALDETIDESKPLKEDRGKAIITYSPTCQFSFGFAKIIESSVRKVAPHLCILLINDWEQPQEAAKQGNWWLTVNGRRIQTFFMETAKFEEEVRLAAKE